MNLAIAFDKNYLTPFYALITSIFVNNSKVPFVFHFIVRSDVTESEKKKISNYVEQNDSKCRFYEVDENLISQFVVLGKWTSSVYYKMFFPLIVPNTIDKMLYLDTDMLVIGHLKPLFEIDLLDKPLGAVYDNYVKVQPSLGIIEEGNYFNSGMLLYNLPIWNDLRISERAISFLTEFPEKIKFVDQCALNGVLLGNWFHISEKYNLLYSYIPQAISKNELNEFIKDKVVIHFTLQRPWNFICKNRLRDLYKYYLKLSPAKKSPVIIDFAISKLPAYTQLRLKEIYFDQLLIQKIWRKFKFLKR